MTTTVLDLPLAGGRPGWSGYGQEKPGSDGEWWCLIRLCSLADGSGMGFILTQDSSCSLSCLGLQDVWHRIVHSTYCGDCSPAALIIQQVSLPAFPLSKDLSQGSWVRGCEPASPVFGKFLCTFQSVGLLC